jgi:hypothetical protein
MIIGEIKFNIIFLINQSLSSFCYCITLKINKISKGLKRSSTTINDGNIHLVSNDNGMIYK